MIEKLIIFTNEFSRYIIPILLVGIPFYGLAVKKVKVYESFVEGAKDGFTIAVRIIPYLVAILVAIGMFRASGALDMLLTMLSPILKAIGFPPENLPLALMRPLSGSGSLYRNHLLRTCGILRFSGNPPLPPCSGSWTDRRCGRRAQCSLYLPVSAWLDFHFDRL